MSNGNPEGRSPRRLRFDDLASGLARSAAAAGASARTHSGRRLVLAAGATILVLWGVLYLAFRDWRARYRERAYFGATAVAPAIDPLANVVPPGIEPRAWREAVERTHSMLVTVTSANLLDVPQMAALRGELEQVVVRAGAHPEQAPRELASVWDAMSERAEFLLQEGTSGRRKGHPRPAILPPRAAPARKPGPGAPHRQSASSFDPASSAPAPK
jgi:hypothetical protein